MAAAAASPSNNQTSIASVAPPSLTLPIERISCSNVSSMPRTTPTHKAVVTPMDRATTTWRTRVCPLAPGRPVPQAETPTPNSSSTPVAVMRMFPQHLDAWPTPTGAMSCRSRAGSWPGAASAMVTPCNVESMAWNAQAACNAPMRGDTYSISSSVSSTPVGGVFVVPPPCRFLPQGIDTSSSSVWPSPSNTPLNTGFIATPQSLGGPWETGTSTSSPFCVDETPIAAASRTEFFRSTSLSSALDSLDRQMGLADTRGLSNSWTSSASATPMASQPKTRRLHEAIVPSPSPKGLEVETQGMSPDSGDDVPDCFRDLGA